MNDKLKGQLDFLIEADKMKSILRQTLLIDKSRRENDAEHSWHIALMAMTLAEYAPFEINLDRVIRMAIVKEALPALWEYIKNVIDENMRSDRIKPAPSVTKD